MERSPELSPPLDGSYTPIVPTTLYETLADAAPTIEAPMASGTKTLYRTSENEFDEDPADE